MRRIVHYHETLGWKTSIRRRAFFARHSWARSCEIELHPPGEFISDQIRATGRFFELDDLIRCASKFDCSDYVDVGANIGNHVAFPSNLGSRCVAFDPSSRNLRPLRANAPQATVHACALGEHEGTDRFINFASCAGNGYLVSNFPSIMESSQPWGSQPESEVVQIRTLDSFGLERVSLLKIDVEGAEMRVLRGADATIRRHRPCIWIELHHDADLARSGFAYRRSDVIAHLRGLGYRHRARDSDSVNIFFSPSTM